MRSPRALCETGVFPTPGRRRGSGPRKVYTGGSPSISRVSMTRSNTSSNSDSSRAELSSAMSVREGRVLHTGHADSTAATGPRVPLCRAVRGGSSSVDLGLHAAYQSHGEGGIADARDDHHRALGELDEPPGHGAEQYRAERAVRA